MNEGPGSWRGQTKKTRLKGLEPSVRRSGGAGAQPSGTSASRRPVIHRELRCRVDLLRREQHDHLRRRSPGSVDGDGGGRRALVIGEVEHDVGVGFAECEVEALKASPETLGHLGHGVSPARSTSALDTSCALSRVRRLYQELRHGRLLWSGRSSTVSHGRSGRKRWKRGRGRHNRRDSRASRLSEPPETSWLTGKQAAEGARTLDLLHG